MLSGAFRERLAGAWVEIRENLGRSTLQTLGVVLGVASVLGGFSISDSQRRRSDERWVKLGGMDRLNVQPSEAIRDGQPTALQTANLGLRAEDAEEGRCSTRKPSQASQQSRSSRGPASARRTPTRTGSITGIGGDYLALNGYTVEKGRPFSAEDFENADAGRAPRRRGRQRRSSRPATPSARRSGVGDIPVIVVGVARGEGLPVARQPGQPCSRGGTGSSPLPATLVARRMQGDACQRRRPRRRSRSPTSTS